MKRAILAVALLSASGFAHGMGWADLWSRPEQQTISQRERAYTEIQGEQYAAAAQQLQGFNDPVSQYNRGNALAHTGDLQGALSAYDAVLHDSAADTMLKKDAQHNRDLVEQQKKSQPQSGKPAEKGGKDQKNDKGGSASKDTKGDKPSSADKGLQDKQNADKDQGGKGNADGDNAKSSQDNKNEPAGGANTKDTEQAQSPEPPRGGQQEKNLSAQKEGSPASARPGNTSPAPPSEQAQSVDQWLRWIPDDPGGLLRRKFMIEHMLKQRGAQQ
jgi:Ca-activated chloride channel family protein